MKLHLKFPLPFVNGLRRSLISYVPSFSLNSNIIENETSYNDDILKLRISMIPVKQHLECLLEKENTTNKTINITSTDFQNDHLMQNIWLFDLKPGQKISIRCDTERGFGYQNARWQVIQTPLMKKLENVEIKKYDLEKIKTISPELIKNNKIDKEKCLIDKTAVQRINEIIPGTIRFQDQGEYELYFEADFYSEIYCLHHALEHLKQLFEKLDYEIIHDPKMKILKFENRSHTFGNILQYYLQKHKGVNFACYVKDHYLNDYILIKFDHEKIEILEEIRKQILEDLNQLEQFCIS